MYQNQSFEDYIRSVLGYPNVNNMYLKNNQENSSVNMFNKNETKNNINIKIEQYYPEIYKVVYPMIRKKCSNMNERVTEEEINLASNEIYNALEGENLIKVNINLNNEVRNNRSRINSSQTRNNEIKNTEANNTRTVKNKTLEDLIKILVIREITESRNQVTNYNTLQQPAGYNEVTSVPQMQRNIYKNMNIYENF